MYKKAKDTFEYSKFQFQVFCTKGGQLDPPVGNGNICTKGGRFGPRVGDGNAFAPMEISWDPVFVT